MPTPKQSRPGGSSPRACSPVRAFRVTCDYWQPPIVSICRVTSPQKARFACWESANDVGYKVEFGHLKVRRAPEYDNAKLIEGRCYGEDFARNILPENAQAVPAAAGGSESTQEPCPPLGTSE